MQSLQLLFSAVHLLLLLLPRLLSITAEAMDSTMEDQIHMGISEAIIVLPGMEILLTAPSNEATAPVVVPVSR